jgi:hypothetical protein
VATCDIGHALHRRRSALSLLNEAHDARNARFLVCAFNRNINAPIAQLRPSSHSRANPTADWNWFTRDERIVHICGTPENNAINRNCFA